MKFHLTFLLLLVICPVFSQDQLAMEEIIQDLLMTRDDLEIDYEVLFDQLTTLSFNPVDLNSAGSDEIKRIFFMEPLLIDQLLLYREQYGKILSIYELKLIPGFDPNTIRLLLPFIHIEENPNQLNKKRPDLSLLSRFEKTRSTTRDSLYGGDNWKVLHRLKFVKGNQLEVGVIFEKDAGEAVTLNRDLHPFDHQAGYFLLKAQKSNTRLLIGDYQIQFGQGLVFGSGFRSAKSAQAVNIGKNSTGGIDPYCSATESGFFRGASAILQKGNLSLASLFSFNKHDARIHTDQNFTYFQSFQKTGLHRSISELETRKSVNEISYGANLSYKWKGWSAFGFNLLHYSYDIPQRPGQELYQVHDFRGRYNAVGSFYVDLNLKQARVFSEIGRSLSGGLAFIGGVTIVNGDLFQLSILYRNYASDFQNKYASSFSENSKVANEKGFYVGLSCSPFRYFRINSYIDFYSFPWSSYRKDFPSRGNDFLLKGNYQRSDTWSMYLQYKYSESSLNESMVNAPLNKATIQKRHNFVFTYNYLPGKKLNLQTRVQGAFTNTNQGLFMAQDLNLHQGPLKFSARVALFDISDYESRQYVYERDVLYAFSIPAYQDYGMRRYLMISYRAGRSFQCWIRASHTIKFKNYNELNSSDQNPVQLKFQTSFRF